MKMAFLDLWRGFTYYHWEFIEHFMDENLSLTPLVPSYL